MAADPIRLGSGEDRFERLYREYAGDVYRYALAIMRNPADAEDVTQTTFLNAWRAFSAGEEPRAPQNWFISIAHNVCRLKFRTNSRRPREVEFEPALAEAPAADGPSASEVLDALAELPLNQRAALVMRELEGRSYTEIASILGVSRAAVETLIFRARRSLRVRRDALRALAVLPLPQSLASFFRTRGAVEAGSAALLGPGVAAKLAAVLAAGVVAVGVGREAVRADATPQPRLTPPTRVVTLDRSTPAVPRRSRPVSAAVAAKPAPTARRAQGAAAAKPAVPAEPATTARRGRLAPVEDEPAGGGTSATPPVPPTRQSPAPRSVPRPEPVAPAVREPEPAAPSALPKPAVPEPAALVPRLPAVPAVPSVAVPAVPAVAVPAVAVPAVPSVAVPAVPAVASPAVAVPAVPPPSVPPPAVPAPTVPALPVEVPHTPPVPILP